jgi:hypothetical protein
MKRGGGWALLLAVLAVLWLPVFTWRGMFRWLARFR